MTTRYIYRWFALCACAVLLAACAAPERAMRAPAGGRADGRILFAVNGNGDDKTDGIYLLTNGGDAKRVIPEGRDYAVQYPRWSPDGQSIAYVRVQDRGTYSDLYIARSNNTNVRQITDFKSKVPYNTDVADQKKYVEDSGIVAGVSWSQEGNFVTFAAGRGATLRPWLVEDTNVRPGDKRTYAIPVTQSLPDSLQVDGTALSPDGKYMAFTVTWAPDGRDKKTQVYVLNFGTKKYYQLTELPEGAYDPTWAPDNHHIAFAGRPGFRVNDIYVMTKDGKNQQQVTQTGAARAPVFSPDGKKLAFLNGAEGQFSVWTMDITMPADANAPLGTGKPEKVFDGIKYIDARSGLAWAT